MGVGPAYWESVVQRDATVLFRKAVRHAARSGGSACLELTDPIAERARRAGGVLEHDDATSRVWPTRRRPMVAGLGALIPVVAFNLGVLLEQQGERAAAEVGLPPR